MTGEPALSLWCSLRPHKLLFSLSFRVPISALCPWIQGSFSPVVEPRGHPQPTLGEQTPPDPLPRCKPPPPRSAPLHQAASPPVPGRNFSPGTHNSRQQLARTFPGTRAGFGRQPGGSGPAPRFPVPCVASPSLWEAGGGVGKGVRNATCRAWSSALKINFPGTDEKGGVAPPI